MMLDAEAAIVLLVKPEAVKLGPGQKVRDLQGVAIPRMATVGKDGMFVHVTFPNLSVIGETRRYEPVPRSTVP